MPFEWLHRHYYQPMFVPDVGVVLLLWDVFDSMDRKKKLMAPVGAEIVVVGVGLLAAVAAAAVDVGEGGNFQ